MTEEATDGTCSNFGRSLGADRSRNIGAKAPHRTLREMAQPQKEPPASESWVTIPLRLDKMLLQMSARFPPLVLPLRSGRMQPPRRARRPSQSREIRCGCAGL